MKNNKLLLVHNILYTLFTILFVATLFVAKVKSNLFIYIIIVALMIIMLVGLWLLYLKDNFKVGLLIIKIKSILKYVATVVFLAGMTFIVFVFQNCANSIFKKDESTVSISDRMNVIRPVSIILIISTVFFIFYLLVLKMIRKEKINKTNLIIFICLQAALIIYLIVELCLVYSTSDMGILNQILPRPKTDDTHEAFIRTLIFTSLTIIFYISTIVMSIVMEIKKLLGVKDHVA